MTTKNLTAVVLAGILAVIGLSACGEEVAQAQAKSVTPRAAQSVTEPSLKVASKVNNEVLKRKPVVKKPLRRVTKTTTVSRSARSGEYRGKYYSPQWESVRKCIIRRESGGNYQAKNKWSSAAGAYQFILSTSNAVAKMMGKSHLVGTSARYWSKADQDQAFWTLFNNGRGKFHWNYPPKQCW